MFFEIYKQGNLIIRGKQILNTISLENELMLAPSTTLVLPIDWLKVINGREEIKIYLDECRVFWGIVWDIEVDKQSETIELDVRHVVTEWQYRQISVNHAISGDDANSKLNIVYKGDKTEVSEEHDESITANGFTVSVAVGSKLTDAEIIEKARASAWVTSNGDKVDITSVKIQKCETSSDTLPADLQKWEDAMEAEYEWSKNRKYGWINPPTIATSKKKGNCVTYVACSLVRAGYLKDGQYFYLSPKTKKITGNAKNYVKDHPELFQLSYPNRSVAQLKSKIHVGDIVGYIGGVPHTMVYMGKNSKGEPIFNSMGSKRIGLGITVPAYAHKKIGMLVRLVGDGETPSETTCTDATLSEEGTYTVTFSTAKGTSVSAEINLTNSEEPSYNVVDDPAVVDKLQDIYDDKNFAYPGWAIDFQDGSEERMIDYVYSRQNKLEALTQTMELTDDLWWRVGLWNEKRIEIGSFGAEQPYILSKKPSGATNIHIIGEPTIDYDFENVVNVATVYSDKSDGGMSSLTLREVYNDPTLQEDGFPVVILHANVNNERDYNSYITQYPKLAPNNEIEYAVLDEESIALESGTVIEGTYSFNDLSPFQIEGENGSIVTDEKRIEAAKTVYHAVIKKLIQARRSYDVHVVTEPIPCDLEVGDKIRFIYDNKIWNMEACSSYWKKVMSADDYYFVTAISYNYDEYGNLTNELTLTKWLKTERESSNT